MFAPLFVYSYLTATMATREESPRNERGAAFTEYVVLLAVVVAAVVGLFATFGDSLGNEISETLNELTAA
jgi:Flp pilus assembly pilin Flp